MNLRKCLLLVAICLSFLYSQNKWDHWEEEIETRTYEYDGKFHNLISQANRIVIRDAGYRSSSFYSNKVLIELTSQNDILNFNSKIKFVEKMLYDGSECGCLGYPRVDWFKNKERIAMTVMRHGRALTWKDFPCDLRFTKESSMMLARWFVERNVWGQHYEFFYIINRGKPHKEILPILITSLKNNNINVKIAAAKILRQMKAKAKSATPMLQRELKKLNAKYKKSDWWQEAEDELENRNGFGFNDEEEQKPKKVIPESKILDAKLRDELLSTLQWIKKKK